MSRAFVAGLGAVSPAGWGVGALCTALKAGQPLPLQPVDRPGWPKPLQARLVPNPAVRPEFLGHPRLRRASPITHYAAAAALEATQRLRSNGQIPSGLGLIVCLQSGCVNYCRRFFGEAIENPAGASPLLFPETVYAGPASHVAALLGGVSLAYTLVGDPGCFLQGLALGTQWLGEKKVDVCLILGSEESDWIIADALWHLDRPGVLAGGAGAVLMCRDFQPTADAELALITDSHTFSTRVNRSRAARMMRGQLGIGSKADLLCDGIGNSSRADAAERGAWDGWAGARLSPKKILGDGLMAGAAWQCVAACKAVAGGQFAAANVSIVGSNQQAIGARFVRCAHEK